MPPKKWSDVVRSNPSLIPYDVKGKGRDIKIKSEPRSATPTPYPSPVGLPLLPPVRLPLLPPVGLPLPPPIEKAPDLPLALPLAPRVAKKISNVKDQKHQDVQKQSQGPVSLYLHKLIMYTKTQDMKRPFKIRDRDVKERKPWFVLEDIIKEFLHLHDPYLKLPLKTVLVQFLEETTDYLDRKVIDQMVEVDLDKSVKRHIVYDRVVRKDKEKPEYQIDGMLLYDSIDSCFRQSSEKFSITKECVRHRFRCKTIRNVDKWGLSTERKLSHLCLKYSMLSDEYQRAKPENRIAKKFRHIFWVDQLVSCSRYFVPVYDQINNGESPLHSNYRTSKIDPALREFLRLNRQYLTQGSEKVILDFIDKKLDTIPKEITDEMLGLDRIRIVYDDEKTMVKLFS
jgi:hypothetical protein